MVNRIQYTVKHTGKLIEKKSPKGKVRGLLHRRCNTLLAIYEDTNFNGLAVAYLKKWTSKSQ